LKALEVSSMRLLLRGEARGREREREGERERERERVLIINLREKRIVITTLKCRILNIRASE
jgi:hypothetical protein